MKTTHQNYLAIPVKSILSFAFIVATGFSQTAPSEINHPASTATPAPIEQPSTTPINQTISSQDASTNASSANTPVKPSLALLTPTEREQVSKAHQQALQDPAVQSTRQIVRMALHKAMLENDPSLQSVLANLDTANSSKNISPLNTGLKSVDDKSSNTVSSTSHGSLTPEDRRKLRAAHDLAMKEPAVIAARKTARVTLYNAMINADPTIGPLLTKAGIKAPANVQTTSKSSSIGSEEKILGSGNGPQWNKEVLNPALKKDNEAAGITSPSPAASTTPVPTNSRAASASPSA